MELSKRLTWIIEKVDKVQVIMDIGTDHGYIPIYLVKNNIAQKVIASDINKDPLKKAKINAALDGVSDKVDLRLGGGLQPLKNNEAQTVIIAGMGGNLIRDILENDFDKVKKLEYLILQPAQNPEVLREYLYTNDYEILYEDICLDDNKYYELFKVRYKKGDYISLENLFYEISPLMLNKKLPLLKAYIESKIEKNKKVIEFITDSTEHAIMRRNELKDKNEKLEKILKNF
ncbi:tRNA (adenine22-N1)-methyltransferase [Clostridium saccharoperbutylacetonicum]|uniref:tRNA (Adenine(22)-N(1))-methyltransferase TrmK n=1 Tax=Clostridium saccharoperbutylacetonicum N1-4(HMT) TaxID=931276 RepID=M1MT57_9CLOT|nr:class I SAM-dependent methyltransferase [Clostridium saccharoperbutylacetonicum]AGF54737.1 tRNA (adenine(22)-N(1))-methyltransferase TrmK [Clostridium saccharoperbutylacetonicum N1-4(HMT)]NRT58742.1 tRNA (adenine22-N1)-methyltransferase [Clostridium saccharoperbutylacetonicum]NSB27931.1 tRNA (adenine22-N1)-methyltransferase [Clostridium saccharoperbutylacetonicum]NSB41414.1 tRNA (adenine22-N1)-methyltransferase [Clostridium saccharoperbutylacetonicum]